MLAAVQLALYMLEYLRKHPGLINQLSPSMLARSVKEEALDKMYPNRWPERLGQLTPAGLAADHEPWEMVLRCFEQHNELKAMIQATHHAEQRLCAAVLDLLARLSDPRPWHRPSARMALGQVSDLAPHTEQTQTRFPRRIALCSTKNSKKGPPGSAVTSQGPSAQPAWMMPC